MTFLQRAVELGVMQAWAAWPMESMEHLFLSGVGFSSTVRELSLPPPNTWQSWSLSCAWLVQAVEETLPGRRALG